MSETRKDYRRFGKNFLVDLLEQEEARNRQADEDLGRALVAVKLAKNELSRIRAEYESKIDKLQQQNAVLIQQLNAVPKGLRS